jgi:phosphohistidine phosphatase
VVGTNATAAEIITAIGWPTRSKAVLIVGHQPTLGRVAATLLSDAEADWHFAKGAVWWLRYVDGETRLFAAVHPKLV